MIRHLIATGAATLALVSLPATAGPTYALTDLGVLDGYTQSFSYGLSDNGHFVVGWLQNDSGTRGFRWSASGGMELLALGSGVTATRAFGVNDSGVVAGESVQSPTQRVATLWGAAGAPAALGTLASGSDPNASSVAFGVNNAGTAAGWSDSAAGTRAFVWAPATGMESLGALPGGTQTRAYSINAGGDIVGWGTSPAGDRGFVATPGLTSVGALSADATSRTRAYGNSNANGWLTGDAHDPVSGDTAFLWSPASPLVALGRLPGASGSFGADVNSDGVAVGWNEGGAGGERAFLWTQQDGMVDFNTAVVGASGWQVQRARSINDLGQVVANAMNADGQIHAVLLSPVPEPATWALWLCGVGSLGLAGWWRRRVASPA